MAVSALLASRKRRRRGAADRLRLAPAAIAGAAPGEWLVFGDGELERLTGVPTGAAGIAGLRAGANGREAIAYRDLSRLRLVERESGAELQLAERRGATRVWALSSATLPALRPTLERVATLLGEHGSGTLVHRALRRLGAAWRGSRS